MADEVRAPGIDLPDSFINSFLDGATGAGKEATGEEEDTTADETGTEVGETQDGQLDSDEDGTEDEVGEEEEESEGDDDGTEEDEDSEGDGQEEDEDSETEDDEDSETDDFLSKKTLKEHQKAIQKDPHLKAVHKSMLRDYTQKTMALAASKQEFEQAHTEYQEFAAALTDVSEGGSREKFLVDVALDNPEVFQRALDQAAELLDDPAARKRHERERDVDQRARQVEAKEKAEARRAQQARVTEIHSNAESYAEKFGIKDERGLKVAKKYVAQVILENRTAGRHQDVFITDEQIRAAVKEASLDIREQRIGGADEEGRKQRQKRLEEVKKVAKSAKRPAAPGGKRAPTATSKQSKPKTPNGMDPLDARIDQLLG